MLEVDQIESPRRVDEAPAAELRPTRITIGMARRKTADGCLVEVGGTEYALQVHPAVSRRLVEEACLHGFLLVVDSDAGQVLGALQTQSQLYVDEAGDVRAAVRRLIIDVEQSALIRSTSSFFQLDQERIELFSREALVRARDTFRVLATLIKLN